MAPRHSERGPAPPDLNRVLTTVDRIYGTATDRTVELWQTVFDACSPLLDSETGGFYCTDKRQASADIARLQGFDLAQALATYQHYGVAADLLYTTSQDLPADTAFLVSQLVGQAPLMASPFFDAVTRPAGMRYVLGVLGENDANQHSLLCFWRSPGQGDFDEADRRMLGLLMPHIRRAAQVHRRLLGPAVSADEARQLSIPTFQHTRHGILALDQAGRVIFRNLQAERILAAEDGLGIRGGRLRAAGARADLAISRSTGPEALAGPPLRIPRPSGELAYELLVMPVRDPVQRSVLPRGTAHMVVLTDPTARTHLKRIFGKLGVASQVELMCALLSGYQAPPEAGEPA